MKISDRDKKVLAEAKITRSRIDAIGTLMDDGLSAEEIAKKMGLTTDQIEKYIDDYGLDWTE